MQVPSYAIIAVHIIEGRIFMGERDVEDNEQDVDEEDQELLLEEALAEL